jgi:hypothetical protein
MIESIDLISIRVAKTEDRFDAKPGELILFENTDGVNMFILAKVKDGCDGCYFIPSVCPRWGCGANDVVFIERNISELHNDTV